MHKNGDGAGILARAFLDYLGDPVGLEFAPPTMARMIGELRRAFYAGANTVIGAIDDEPDPGSAAEAIMIMMAELVTMAEETLLTDLVLHEKEPSDAKP